jgi:cell division protein FtsB
MMMIYSNKQQRTKNKNNKRRKGFFLFEKIFLFFVFFRLKFLGENSSHDFNQEQRNKK